MNERFYRGDNINSADPAKTFVQIDIELFRKPYIISLENIGNSLKLKFNNDINKFINERNVISVEYVDQAFNKELMPLNTPISKKTYISIDENYIYVWIPKLEKWKRVLLSDW